MGQGINVQSLRNHDVEGDRYKLTISLDVVEHLGDGLYSNVAAVLTEAVANAWDADSLNVNIDLDISNDQIFIKDNGVGMDVDEVNDRFLTVGYKKRNDGDTTERGRSVMGRKGIGKLSLFSIANKIHVETKKEGGLVEAFEINLDDLKDAINKKKEYNPTPVQPSFGDFLISKGTVIKLTQLRMARLTTASSASLRRMLARRFTIIGSDEFKVLVDSIEVSPSDRGDLKFTQYVWKYAGTELSDCTLDDESIFELSNKADGWEDNWVLSGWIGTVDKPTQLDTSEGNLNSIVIHSRGRLADEDILDRVTSAEIYTKYVTGQIRADFLDESSKDDIVTSNRQRLREDDERVQKLLSFVRTHMRIIANEWSALRTGDKIDELREAYPRIDDWLTRLPDGWKNKAEKMLGSVVKLEIDSDNPEETRKSLVRHSIYGFERLRLRGDAEALSEAIDGGVEKMLLLFADRSSLEAALYRDIVSNRLSVINEFENMVDENDKEKVLQEHLFNNLWLLDPSWDRATENTAIEDRLKLLNVFSDSESVKDKYGRVDIRYRHVSGKHLIVELKRAGVRPDAGQLLTQVTKYYDAYESKGIFSGENVEIAIILGELDKNAEKAIQTIVPGSVVKTYDMLIVQAKNSYQDYLEKTKSYDFIENVLD